MDRKTLSMAAAALIAAFGACGAAEAAVAVDPAAVKAIEYGTVAAREINDMVNFYKIGLKFVGPNPVAGYSVVRALGAGGAYESVFSKLEHNRKSKEKEKEQLWEELIGMREGAAIRTLSRALAPAGRGLFGPGWPKVRVPGGAPEETFVMEPEAFKYIVPIRTGIVIASSGGFDISMQEYLKSMGMFYPVLTFSIPIPKEIAESKFAVQIREGLERDVPGAKTSESRINVTVMPDLDSLNHLIYKTRENLVDGTER